MRRRGQLQAAVTRGVTAAGHPEHALARATRDHGLRGAHPAGFEARLGPLGLYDATIATFPLRLGSPAIAAGDLDACDSAAVNLLDQRGVPRGPLTCDIGRKEREHALAQFCDGRLSALVSAQVLNASSHAICISARTSAVSSCER